MKMQKFYPTVLIILFAFIFSSCSAIAGIFKAGMGFGIFLVVLVVVIIIAVAAKATKK